MNPITLHSSLLTYPLRDVFEAAVALARRCAPAGLTEKWGVVMFDGRADFRLTLGRYRVIHVAPYATRVGVFMEWRKVLARPELYEDDPDFIAFEDAFGCLGVANVHQPWNVTDAADLEDRRAAMFLECGMRLIVKDILCRHPRLRLRP